MPLPHLQVENLGASLKLLSVDNTDLTRNKRSTLLTEDVVALGTTIRVQSVIGFESLTTSSGQLVCIGDIGNERTEILRTSQDTGIFGAADRKEITLRDSLQFDHAQDTKVYILDWNRMRFRYAASATGSKVTLAAYPVAIQPDMSRTYFRDITEPANRLTGAPATAFYFAGFNDSIRDSVSDDSDAVYGTGYDDNTVFAIKKRALDELGEKVDGDVITHEFLNQALWQARREYHQEPGKRPFRRVFNVDIGNALTGSYRIELPTNTERPFTAENIYGVRIGTEANMTYYDKKEWDFDWRNKPHSTLEHAYVYGSSTSLWLTNGRDFGLSAVISVEGENISVTRNIDLSGESFYNSLRIYAHPTGGYDASTGSDAFENVSLGLPSKFTVFAQPGGSAYIYFNRAIDTAYVNQNIYLDHYRTLLGFDTDGDVLDEPKYDMYVSYLKARIKQKRTRGAYDFLNDPDYKLWLVNKEKAINSEYLATDIRIEPDVAHLPIPE